MNSPATAPVSSWIGEFILLAALWGASFLFMRQGAAEFGPLPVAGLRVGLAALFLWPLLLRQGHYPAFRRHWRPILLAGVINSAIPFALFAWAVWMPQTMPENGAVRWSSQMINSLQFQFNRFINHQIEH